MAIVEENLLVRARGLLTEKQQNVEYALGNLRLLIPSAITLLYQRKTGDAKFAQNFIVQTADIEIQPGEFADAADQFDSTGIVPSEVCSADIVFATPPIPPVVTVQMVKSLDRLNMTGIQDAFFIKCFQHGTNFTFKHPTDELAGLTFRVRGECVSTELAKLPAALEGALSLIIADLAPKQGKPNDLGLQIAARKL